MGAPGILDPIPNIPEIGRQYIKRSNVGTICSCAGGEIKAYRHLGFLLSIDFTQFTEYLANGIFLADLVDGFSSRMLLGW